MTLSRPLLLLACAAVVSGVPFRGVRALHGQPAPPLMVGRGVVSTDAPEFASAVTPDGRELYFTRASSDRTRLTVMVAHRAPDGEWSTPVVGPFSGTFRDVDPFITPDGRRLYFSSDRPRRPGGPALFAMWYVERFGTGWGAPVDPGPPLNSEAGDVYVSAARDGTVIFTSSRLGTPRLFTSRPRDGVWLPPVAIALGTRTDAGNPAIAPSGRFLIVTLPGAAGDLDLFVSCRAGEAWGEPRALAAVNSPFADFAPFIDATETTLYFTSERPGIVAGVAAGQRPPGDVYRLSLDAAGVHCA